MKHRAVLGLIAGLASLLVCLPSSHAADTTESNAGTQEGAASFSPYVDAEGNISRPENFRSNWVHLGTWFVKDDEHARGPGVHDVYTTREVARSFKENGQWADGTPLVKEIRGISEEQLTTGNAQWASDVGVWFVMIRDRENRFPDNASWGEGWGWALFKADNPSKNVNTNWKQGELSNCFGCHIPAKNTEWVFIEGYPTVRDAAQ